MELTNYHKEYVTDKKLVYSCQYHIIFCPKYRRRVLINGIDQRLKEIVAERQHDFNFKLIEIEVMPDHVHMLLGVNPRIGIYPTMTKLKGYLSHQLREEFPELKTKLPCLWTNSSFISTVGSVSLETVKQYIENQKKK
jgi:putative transposase